MAVSYVLGGEIKEDRLFPCFFLFGAETFLAHEFVRQLRDVLISPNGEGFNVERFDLEETRWADVIDLARTLPFFFSPWRIIVVESSDGGPNKLSSLDEKIIRDYLNSPSSRTVLVVILSGKIKKYHAWVKFFSTLPPSAVFLKELKPLKGRELSAWMSRKLESLDKRATFEATKRLEEIVGNDLRRIDNELNKIANFVAERKVIDFDDVNQICDWVRAFVGWELANSLEKADYEQTLRVLDQSFKQGVKPEYLLGVMASFFRDILMAKMWLREKKERKEIFAELRPQFKSPSGDKFKEFFSLVEGYSFEDLQVAVRELEKSDLLIKTSDISAQALLEAFVFAYCRRRNKQKRKPELTWKERG